VTNIVNAVQNFLANAAEAQIEATDNEGNLTTIGRRLEALDTFFTIIFTVELAINAFAHWFHPFITDGWNVFDCIVVTLSLVALGPLNIPMNVLRSLRAFRVVRLFGRMGALRDIVSSLTAAISPVLNAFLIMLIVGSICEDQSLYPRIASVLPCLCLLCTVSLL
jgi:voltage-gated sodium channel